MAGVNKEGTRRGMCFTPRWDKCKDCGAPIWKDAAKRQLCASCRTLHEDIQKEKQRIRSRRRYYRMKEGKEEKPATQQEKEYECKVWRQCRYGGDRFGCAYAAITGRLRTDRGEHMIVNGKCDLFQTGRKKRSGWHDTYAADGSGREE